MNNHAYTHVSVQMNNGNEALMSSEKLIKNHLIFLTLIYLVCMETRNNVVSKSFISTNNGQPTRQLIFKEP